MKFSVLMDRNRHRHMARTRSFGAGSRDAAALPISDAAPTVAFNSPNTVSPPFSRLSSNAGRAAL